MTEKKKLLTSEKQWALSSEEVLEDLNVSLSEGLEDQEVIKRRKLTGRNLLQTVGRKSAWVILLDQVKSILVILLFVAASFSFVFGELIEGFAILGVILINTAIGFFTELRAVRAMEAIEKMSNLETTVRRSGKVKKIPAEDLVPGDIVLIESGEVVTADLRLIDATNLQVDESALTGESVPVQKKVDRLDSDTTLVERANMLYKGTAITRGSGKSVVVSIGMATELGQISSLVEEADEELTPLEKRLDQLGHRLVWITLVLAFIVVITGIISGKDILLMIETGIAMAVATVPEGLPIVATIALARGMQRMARRNTLINRLSSVEVLGATNVIFTDKTGTLTENQMTVVKIALDEGDIQISGEGLKTKGQFYLNDDPIDPEKNEVLNQILRIGVLCNNAELQFNSTDSATDAIGDPLDVAFLVVAAKANIFRDELLKKHPVVREVAFDPNKRMMATFDEENGNFRIAVKGAPEPIINASSHILTRDGKQKYTDEIRKKWFDRNDQIAEEGLRVLAIATRKTDNVDDDPYRNLTFLGLSGLLDPPREEVRKSLKACMDAGIRVVMVTGDHPATARKIALDVGLIEKLNESVIEGKELESSDDLSEDRKNDILNASIFARVSPEQKFDLIKIYQKAGQIVAMTGDGVNDAPALKKADIGVAMGQRGTQVAREAADMILQDDNFSSIIEAVEQGRIIFDNIRKFVLYLLSCNMSEIAVISLASIFSSTMPITPLQILFLNLVTDVFPALALGMSEGEPDIMNRKPRDIKEPILNRQHWIEMGGYSTFIALVVLGVMVMAQTRQGISQDYVITISFLTLAFAQLWHVFNLREKGSMFFKNEIVRNPWVWGALGFCTTLLFAAVYIPGLNTLLSLVDPGLTGWGIVLGTSLLPWVAGQIYKSWGKKSA